METKRKESKSYDISTLSRLMKKDFIFVIAVFLILLLIFTDISIYESFGSVRSRKLEAQNLALLYASEIRTNYNNASEQKNSHKFSFRPSESSGLTKPRLQIFNLQSK